MEVRFHQKKFWKLYQNSQSISLAQQHVICLIISLLLGTSFKMGQKYKIRSFFQQLFYYQMASTKIICAFLLLLVLVTSHELYKKVIHNIDPNAKCLDGSPPAVYVHQGSQPQNILIITQGGITCFAPTVEKSLESCAKRSQTDLGSSLFLADTMNGEGKGILEIKDGNGFKEWTKIYLHYCDGTGFIGNNEKPVETNGNTLFFRGSVNMRAHLKWIDEKYSFDKAKKIVFAGQDVGGMAVYLWIDYLRGLLSDPSKLYGIVDSGIMLDPVSIAKVAQSFGIPLLFPGAIKSNKIQSGGAVPLHLRNTAESVKQFLKVIIGDERPPNTHCLDTLTDPGSDWKCLFAPKAFKTLKTKMLWIDSQYDSIAFNEFLDLNCLSEGKSQLSLKNCDPTQLLLSNLYRELIQTYVLTDLIKDGHSVWSIACSWHDSITTNSVYDEDLQRVAYLDRRLTVKDAVEAFVLKNEKIVAIDKFCWPSNKKCAY